MRELKNKYPNENIDLKILEVLQEKECDYVFLSGYMKKIDISLILGTTLNEIFKWDNTNTRFDLSDDLNVNGNLATSGQLFQEGLVSAAVLFQQLSCFTVGVLFQWFL